MLFRSESKDKTQLIQIAEALGVKASTRLKKADIIDQILAKTGGSRPSTATASDVADVAPTAPTADETAAAPAAPQQAPAVEPKAEWELALDTTDGSDGSASANGAPAPDTAPADGPGEAPQGDAEPADAKQGDAEQIDAKQIDAKQGDARQGDARQGDARQAGGQQRSGQDRKSVV